MKKLLCILSLAAVLFAGCGPRSQIEDLKRDVKSLKEADAALWAEMSAAIDALEKELLGRIQDTKDKLNKSIDEAVADLMSLMNNKLQDTQKYLETELAAKKKLIDEHVAEVTKNSDNAFTLLDQSLDVVQDFLLEAIAKNDKAQEALMHEMAAKIEKMSGIVTDAQQQAQAWQERLDNIQEEGMYEAIAALEADANKLKEFNIQKSVSEMERRLEKFSKIVLDDLTEDQMREVKDMLSEMEGWYSDVEGFVSDSESMADEMDSMLSEWESTADDYYNQLDSYTSDLSDRLDYLADFLESSYDDATDLESDVNDWLRHLETLNADLTDWSERTQAMSDDWDGQHDDIDSRADDLSSLYEELEEASHALMYDVDAYIDAHPWMFD